MAEKKVHKMEAPNPVEPTPQSKKAKDLRAAGFSYSEIAARFKITRREVEALVAKVESPIAPVEPSMPKLVKKPKKGK